MSTLPSWYPDADAETKPAPGPLLLVQAFVNTVNLEDGTDMLAEPDAARAWLVEAGLLRPRSRLTEQDLDAARAVRTSIRSLLGAGGAPVSSRSALTPLRRLARNHRARVAVA